MPFVNPLELETILVNFLAGNSNVFLFLFTVVIASLAAKFRMPNEIFLIMVVIFAVIMGNFFGSFYAFALIVSSVIVFYGVGKVIKS